MYWTYILYSKMIDKFYIGHTGNLDLRLQRHNQGWSRSTKSGIPWEIVYFELFKDKSDAIKRELAIKRKKSRKYISEIINNDE